ncbi:hypothetical protein Syun_012919 [Stephania yunnanensis]|uniref:rRNA biogenesis protein RRP36 n=1 Tax=Stephania yunnanensis TaxID=152371 RepID=A0AAP0K150_9MAGN
MDVGTSSVNQLDGSDEHELSSEEEELERELADVTFEELQKARANGFHSMHRKSNEEKKGGRANKNRPMEISSKKPVGRFRDVIQAPKKIARDPRFESLSGTLDVDGFRKRYNFLFDTHLPSEKQELKKLLKKTNDPEVTADLKNRISWIDKQLKTESAKSTEKAILTEHKKKEREATKQGKRPFYLKRSKIREMRLVEKYKNLKETGKLESAMERRLQKNASKDRRYIPYRRSDQDDHQ